MTDRNGTLILNKTDYLIALAVGVCALAVYVRTLAPDVLYGDSAEFQTLAYTLGTTHSTGYPIYLLLARLLGYLPLDSPAWRINLLSALSAAVTLSVVFLLIRHLTPSRIGALQGSVAFGLSYTFWSQAIIAEVYTPALAFLGVIVLLLWRWHRLFPKHNRLLLFAALMTALGLGVHAFVVLIAPVATALVIWTLWSRSNGSSPIDWSQRRRALLTAMVGVLLGGMIYLLAFLSIDLNNPPSSFIRVALNPSRSIWGLEATDLDSPFERLWLTVTGLQWQDAMFPENIDLVDESTTYYDRLSRIEFSPLMLLCALLGVAAMLFTAPSLGVFWLVALVTILFFILNYQPPDKYIFYLPTYLLVVVALGAGAGSALEWLRQYLVVKQKHRYLGLLYPLAVVLLFLMVVQSVGASRWLALRAGAATFVQEDYVYPLRNLEEPRRLATRQINPLPDDAVLLMGWRALYTMYYLAHVEQLRPNITIMEASPHGGQGIADTMIQTLEDALREDRPVFADRIYPDLRSHFRVQPALEGRWYRLLLLEVD
jgi:hypothetical protein